MNNSTVGKNVKGVDPELKGTKFHDASEGSSNSSDSMSVSSADSALSPIDIKERDKGDVHIDADIDMTNINGNNASTHIGLGDQNKKVREREKEERADDQHVSDMLNIVALHKDLSTARVPLLAATAHIAQSRHGDVMQRL